MKKREIPAFVTYILMKILSVGGEKMANDTYNYQTGINSATDVNRTKVSADGYNDARDEEDKSANNIEALADRLVELGQKMSNVWTDEAGQAHIRENNNLAQMLNNCMIILNTYYNVSSGSV